MSPLKERLCFAVLGVILCCYSCARVLQVITGPTPRLSLVALEVVASLAFAFVDGSRTVGIRRILAFAAICTVVGNVMENVGVATGLPFGHYVFLDVMGPKLFRVPVLLGLAYIGMAYVSWTLASVTAGPGSGRAKFLTVPVLASFIMAAWDLAQDPVWSTILKAWRWRDGGAWFGVPVSNYFGWLLTVFLIYVTFAAVTSRSGKTAPLNRDAAWPSIALYLLCAGGNVLQLAAGRAAAYAQDGSGVAWRVSAILSTSALVSIFVMGGFAAVAAARSISRTKRSKIEQLA